MIDDFYQAALAAMRHHLDEAAKPYTLDDGELVIDGHRLGLSITFEGFVEQGGHVLAPLDVQIHVDGDSGDRFRVGTLGVGNDREAAKRDAISEWHMLAVTPLMAALGAAVEGRRAPTGPKQLAGWDLFAGRAGVRGTAPAELSGREFSVALFSRLRDAVARWEQPPRYELRSIFVLASCTGEAREVQAAIDGLINEELTGWLERLEWPKSKDAYLFKQLFVLRHEPSRD